MSLVKSEEISSLGSGRRDYSADVLFSSESLIRNYQDVYSYHGIMAGVAAGGSSSTVITLTASKTVFVLNVAASTARNVLCRITVESYDNGTYTTVMDNYGFMNAGENIRRGVEFTDRMRVTIYNYGESAQDFVFYLTGLQLDTDIYLRENPLSEAS